MVYFWAYLNGFHDIGPYLLAGVMLAGVLLALRGPSAHSCAPYRGGFTLKAPWEKRVFLGLMGLQALLVPLAVANDNVQSLRRGAWIEAGVFTVICWVGAAFLFWQSGPRELALNEAQRTYRRAEGWPPFQRTSTGPLSDLSGVWAERDTDANTYLVYVGWQGKRSKMLVEQFSSSLEGAQYFASELAATLGIPCLDSDPSAPSLPYRVPADQHRPQWIVQDGRTVPFQEWAREQEAQKNEAAE